MVATQTKDILKEAPNVLPFLPLLYVGWADNALMPSEIKLIREKADEMDWLTATERELIIEWSNPTQPPSPELMGTWVKLIREASEKLDTASRQSLADLSLQMAESSSATTNWNTPAARMAMEEMELALGYVNLKDYRNILSEEQRKKAEELDETPCFDYKEMARLLDGEHADIKNRVRQLFADPEFQLRIIKDKEEHREQTLKWCKLMAAQGLGSISYPEANGGSNDIAEYAAVFETMGYHDISLCIKFGVQFGLFGGSILGLGTQKHYDKYLTDVGTLDLPGCFAMTETGHGSNVRQLETTATYDPASQEFIIHTPHENAGKEYIGNALHGKMASVFAQLITNGDNQGVHAFLVPLRNDAHETLPGIRVEDCGYKVGLNGVDNGRIWFTNVRIPRENLLNRFGDVDAGGNYDSPIGSLARRFFTMLGTLVGGRVCVPMAGLSAAKKGLAIAIKHALKRRQFGPENEAETLLLDYPSHQRRLMPLLAKAYALDAAHKYLLKRFANRTEKDSREIETLAAALKSYSTWNTTHTLQMCREACGGKGYLAENQFADLKADTDIFTTFEGDNTVLMQLVAKGLLTDLKEEFENTNFWELFINFSKQYVESLSPFNDSGNTEEEHLVDTPYHVDLFKKRERRMAMDLGQRIRRNRKMGMDPYDAFIRCQNDMIALGHAHAERIVVEQFATMFEQVEDLELKNILDKLCDLYALHTIEQHKGWYLEKGYMKADKTEAVSLMVDKLCADLRTSACCLVDAFNIPEHLLVAPIAV